MLKSAFVYTERPGSRQLKVHLLRTVKQMLFMRV